MKHVLVAVVASNVLQCSDHIVFFHNLVLVFCMLLVGTVLWIRIVFNADPGSAFYLNVDPYSGSQTSADLWGAGSVSGSCSDFAVTKS